MQNDPQVDENVAPNQDTTKNFDEDLLKGFRVDENYNEPILEQVLRIAVYEEFKAYEICRKVIETFGNVQPFSNIIQAEVTHINALEPLLIKYNVPAPINDCYDKIELPNTLLECCELGVATEIKNIQMYDNLVSYMDQYPDVKDLLFQLQAASYNNHLPAYRKCVTQHTTNNVDPNSFANQNPNPMGNMNQNMDEVMGKMNEFNELAGKFASGEVSQEELLKVLSNTNLSFVGGALLGAVGMSVFSQMSKQHPSNEEE